ncbi:NYN domain-containing protein [Candidatus Saccharibacteria bacterium]|nr:NYN domain-containing protein [Candidatus Saccharibacteria bacterium]
MKLIDIKTFVYIDASNIRSACLNSCGFRLNFAKLCKYFRNKYPNLEKICYYEGLSKTDDVKRGYLEELSKNSGCKICTLERKSYTEPPRYQKYICKECKAQNNIKIAPRTLKLKSNVDVYLATDMMVDAYRNNDKMHIIVASCDGDYAEAIQNVLKINPEAYITILATPRTAVRNCLSSRLKMLSRTIGPAHYSLADITNIKDLIMEDALRESQVNTNP